MRVAIIGAGPGGLVLCKSLLEATDRDFPFDPIIFEQEDDIGGTFRYRAYEVTFYSSAGIIMVADNNVVNFADRTVISSPRSNLHPSQTFACHCLIRTI